MAVVKNGRRTTVEIGLNGGLYTGIAGVQDATPTERQRFGGDLAVAWRADSSKRPVAAGDQVRIGTADYRVVTVNRSALMEGVMIAWIVPQVAGA